MPVRWKLSASLSAEGPAFPPAVLPPAVQALASQGGEIALDDTFVFDIACSNQLGMSPSFRGSDPYPYGSLTYRTLYSFSRYPYIMLFSRICQGSVKTSGKFTALDRFDHFNSAHNMLVEFRQILRWYPIFLVI